MGMYTELIFGAKLKKDTPESVINTLRYMIGDIDKPEILEFDANRNPLIGGSYYFGVTRSVSNMYYNLTDKRWQISTRANIKNYEGEIDQFLTWIKPYIEQGSGTRDMYAIKIYEEQEEPTIYYLDSELEG